METLTVKVFAITNGKEGISPDDYEKNKESKVILNTANICYITEPKEFRTIFSGKLVGEMS